MAAAGTAGAAGVAGVAACTGSALPLTGVCSDANPALFLATDNSLDTFARGCVWRTQELLVRAKQALVFRAQDCTGEKWDKTIYIWVDHYVKSYPENIPADQATFALEVFEVPDGQTAEDVAMQTLAKAPDGARCQIKPKTGVKVAGRAFELGPNAELTKELNDQNAGEPWQACGPNGVDMDSKQFWEGRKGHALFHMLGQDQPGWDPASFTFYEMKADGSWAKAG